MDFDEMQAMLRGILSDEGPPAPVAAKPAPVAPPPVPEATLTISPPPLPESVPRLDSDDFLSQLDAELASMGIATQGLPVPPAPPPLGEPELPKDEPEPIVITPQDVAEVVGPVDLDALLAEDVREEAEEAEAQPVIFQGNAPTAQPQQVVPMPTFTTDEIAETMDIRNFATLVTFNTSRWHGKVKDRKAAEHIAAATGADQLAFETQKRLLTGADAKLKAVHKTIDDARTLHYNMTLPWSTIGRDGQGKRTGGRLLPNTMFMEYITAMSKAKAAMEKATDEFEADYANAIAKAQTTLGSRFDPTEYPNPQSIRAHFGLSFDFHPVPVGNDFRGLADQQISKLAHTLEKKNRTMLENAMQETWTRAYELVKQAAERFSTPDALFHYTLVDKLRDAATNLQNLNVTGDECIERVRKVIAKHLCSYDAKDIRGDEALRKRLGQIATACLEEMTKYAADKKG